MLNAFVLPHKTLRSKNSRGTSSSETMTSNHAPALNRGRLASLSILATATCSDMTPCASHCRCQAAKSAYWTGKGPRPTLILPRWKALYAALSSFQMMPVDQPSVTLWCMVSRKMCSSSLT